MLRQRPADGRAVLTWPGGAVDVLPGEGHGARQEDEEEQAKQAVAQPGEIAALRRVVAYDRDLGEDHHHQRGAQQRMQERSPGARAEAEDAEAGEEANRKRDPDRGP